MLGRLIAAMCTLGLAACATAPGATAGTASNPSPSLEGTRWTGVVGESPDPRSAPRLEFIAGGRLTGFTGCNMMSGWWTMDGGVVRLDRVMTTKRMCEGPGGEAERRVLAALGEGGRVTHEGGKLVLSGPGGARMEFVPAR